MTTVKVTTAVRWLVLGLVGGVVAMTGCSSDTAGRGSQTEPTTPAQAQEILAKEGPSGEGTFPGGTFDFGSPFDNSTSPFDSAQTLPGRLASASWDVYWQGNGADRGSWGVGIDVFRTSDRAARALEEDEAFWCPTRRRGIEDFASGELDDVRTSTCPRAGGDGFYATLDASDGSIVTHLTVGGATRPAAVAALRAVWPPIRDAVVRVRTSLG